MTLTHEQIVQAITNLCIEAHWTLSGDNYDDIVWSSNTKKPTLQELEEEIAAIPARLLRQEADKAAAKTAAEAKLAALGLTADDLKALGL